MAGKKSFVLRLSQSDYEALEKWASDEFRSVNGQLEWILNRALREAGRKGVQKGESGSKTGEDDLERDRLL